MGLYVDFWKSWIPNTKEKLEQSAENKIKSGGKCKICCACPSERRERDECLLLRASLEDCRPQIENFYTCLLSEGFTQEDIDRLRKSSKF